jgi:hypothetical protein
MVRTAKFTDIRRITDLLIEAHGRSRLADTDCKVDVKYTKAMLMRLMQRHGGKTDGSTLILVSERDGAVAGVIAGITMRVQEFCDKLAVTDLFFYQSPIAPPRDAREMVRQVTVWGWDVVKAFEITVGVTDIIGDYRRAGRMYERMGFEQKGVIYGMRAAA